METFYDAIKDISGKKPQMAPPLNHNLIINALKQSMFSGKLMFYDRVESTNDLAKAMALEGAENGTVIIAEEQTSGRGRMGRKWLSPPSSNLLFSLLLRPDLYTEKVFTLTMLLALSTVEAVETQTGVNAMIKWPNDIYVQDRKLAGILTEFSVTGNRLNHVILGIGINVNWDPEEATDSHMLYPATSLMREAGHTVSREFLLINILSAYETHYMDVSRNGPARVQELWNKRSMLTGRNVSVEISNNEVINGTAIGIDEKGALLVSDINGQTHTILNGDVHIKNVT